MTWIRLDDDFPNHPKVIGLTDSAFRLYVTVLCYSGKYLTDGVIITAVAKRYSTIIDYKKLVNVGLLTEIPEGYFIKNYSEYQTTKEEVEAKKEASRTNMRSYRAKKKDNKNPVTDNKSETNQLVSLPHTHTHTHTPNKDIQDNPTYVEIAKHLAKRIEQNGSKPPNVTDSWISDVRLMIERDGRTEEQVRYIIDWCQNDSFWRSNILSPSKLRAKFDQLRLNAEKETSRKVPQGERFIKDFLSESLGELS